MKVKEAIKITEGFTRTSKMPGLSYSLPAWECKTGSKLRKVKGSVCASCYALKGNYTRYPAIKAAQYRRLEAMKHPAWVDAMITVIKRQKWFRWHDAGDVQDLQHLNNIFKICEATPDTKHWLPTREAWIQNAAEHRAPDNLTIRFSHADGGPAQRQRAALTTIQQWLKAGASVSSSEVKTTKCRRLSDNCWNKEM